MLECEPHPSVAGAADRGEEDEPHLRQFYVGQTSECAGKLISIWQARGAKISSALLLRTRVRAVRRLLEESA